MNSCVTIRPRLRPRLSLSQPVLARIFQEYISSVYLLPSRSRPDNSHLGGCFVTCPDLPPEKDYDVYDPTIHSLMNKLVLGDNYLKGFKMDWNKLARILKER